MATRNIDTTSPQYQTRLTQIQQIKAFYGPVIADYLNVHKTDPDAARAWRQGDPILREMLDIYRQIAKRVGSHVDN